MIYLSVIIPVYNAEKYLEDCVNSILNQQFSDYEILLIDDGSTDGSAALCDRLSMENEAVKHIMFRTVVRQKPEITL